jgi:Mrp family chromosome partitioning ATPase
LAACENDQTAAVAVAAAAAFMSSSVPGRGVPTTAAAAAAAAAENSVSKSSSDIILGSPVVFIFFCMSGVSVDLLACYHYNKDRKVFQFFPEFNVSVHFIFFFMK